LNIGKVTTLPDPTTKPRSWRGELGFHPNRDVVASQISSPNTANNLISKTQPKPLSSVVEKMKKVNDFLSKTATFLK
jgi:hypothetical protein